MDRKKGDFFFVCFLLIRINRSFLESRDVGGVGWVVRKWFACSSGCLL